MENPPIIIYRWTHSVEGTPIVEIYKATPEGLILVKALSQSFGAGHPYNASEINGTFTYNESYMIYSANYNIGKTLIIEAWRDYQGSIRIIVGDQEVSCSSFYHGVIKVEP
jgi:hypothetical protein